MPVSGISIFRRPRIQLSGRVVFCGCLVNGTPEDAPDGFGVFRHKGANGE